MEKRYIGKQEVSLLGMGCMRLPKIEGKDEIDVTKVEEMIAYSMSKGITYYDTAYPYHNGLSEIVIGKVLNKYPRESYLLADKLPIWECKTLEDAKNIFYKQLEKCNVEYFDFYLCHAMNLDSYYLYKKLDVFSFLEEMKACGKIRNLGFSFHDAAQNILPIANELEWDFAQIQLNYLDYEMQDAKKQYEILTEKNISVVVMEPVRGGLLANVCDEAKNIFKNIRPNDSIASWALRYVAHFPNVKVILSGMSNMEQLSDNINTFTNYQVLTDKEHEAIENAKNAILGNDFIPCTGCRYCMPCPFGVDIPKIFSMFNMYGIHKNLDKFKESINKLNINSLPNNCHKCGKCMKHCPQHIDIIQQLEKINAIIQN